MSYEIFERLCKQKGITPAEVSRRTGIAKATLTNWKKGNYTPKADKMQKIAELFGVSSEYLLTGSDPSEPYYINDDTRDLAQFLYEHPEYKVIFDASRKTKAEDFEYVIKFLERTNQ